jgi:hypothetical protein
MARTDEYGHQADGNRPAERAKRRGYEYCIVSENIAAVYNSTGFTTKELARQLFQGWRHSPGHRKNMLNPDVVETGVAVARSEQTDYYYAVQMFGRPKSEMVAFQITNTSGAVLRYEVAGRTFVLPPRYSRTHGQCRPADLTVHWPNGQESTTVRPPNGGRYTAVREGSGRFKLGKE